MDRLRSRQICAIYQKASIHTGFCARALALFAVLGLTAHAQFSPAGNSPYALPSGSGPKALVVADFDGNFYNDLAVADYNTNNVTVMLNNTSGGFTSTSYPVGHKPIALAVVHFNSAANLAVVNSGDNTVTLLVAGSGGSFTVGNTFSCGSQCIDIAVGDIDGDFKDDLAILNGTGTVTLFRGDGTGGFTAFGSPVPVGPSPSALAFFDLNDDSLGDLIVANSTTNTVTVMMGGSGFTPAFGSPYPVGNHPSALAIADFNGDLIPDIAVANQADGTITVLLGGSGFAPAPSSPTPAGANPVALATGDFNGDFTPDLAVVNSGGTLTVLLGGRNGGFVPAPQSPFAVGSNPSSVASGDMRGDDRDDLSIANFGSNNVTVLYAVQLAGYGPQIAAPIGTSSEIDEGPTHYGNITDGTSFPGAGRLALWIAGIFNTGDEFSISWYDPVTGTTTDITSGIFSIYPNQIQVFVPPALFSNPISSPDTITVTVTDTLLNLSAHAPLVINPAMSAPQLCYQGAAVGQPYSQALITGGTPPYLVSLQPSSLLPPGFPTPDEPLTGTPTTVGIYTFYLQFQDSWGNTLTPVNQYTLQVAAVPGISVSPGSIPAGSPATQLTISGTGLLPPASPPGCSFAGSQLNWGIPPSGTLLPTTVSSTTAATATVPAALLVSPGVVDVVLQQPGPGADSNPVPITITAPAINTLSPPSVNAGAPPFTLTVTGSSFIPGSTIMFGTTSLTTTFVNSGSLTATVSTAQVANSGPVSVTVVNPGGAASVPSTFTVLASAISGLTPSSVVAGSAGFTLKVNGPSFVSGSQIFFGATGLTTTFQNSTTLTAPVTAAMVSTPGQVPITVVSPGPITSPPFTFTITPAPNPTPTITLPLQSSPPAAGGPTIGNAITGGTNLASFLLYINGFFNAGYNHTVSWVNTATNTTTTFTTSSGIQSVSPTQIVVAIPAALFNSLVSGAVTVNVTVAEQPAIASPPPPTISNVAPFLINPPLATSAVTFPEGTVGVAYSQPLTYTGGTAPFSSSLAAGSLPLGLNLSSGAGPLTGSPTAAGTFNFTIKITDAWGNTAQAADSLTIITTPTIAPPLIPASGLAGSGSFTLTVNGTNFIVPAGSAPGSVAEWVVSGSSPVQLTTVVANATQLTATVPANLVQSPATVGIVVAQPNGVTSNSVSFPVLGPSISSLSPSSMAAGSAAFTITVNGSNFSSNAQVVFGGTTLATTFVNSGSLSATVTAPLIAVPAQVPVTVVNPGSVSSSPSTFTVTVNPVQTPTITPPLQSSPLTSSTPTLGNAITSGANLTAFLLYINGHFNAGDNHTVTWLDTSTNTTTTFTSQNGIQSVSPTQIVVSVPAALFSTLVTTPVTVKISVTEQEPISSPPPAVTSNSANFLINPPLATTTFVFPNGSQGVAYSQPVMFSGGTAPFSFKQVNGTLPAGLSLAQDTGVLSGSPTVAGDYTFGVEITDAWGDKLDATYYMQAAAMPDITVALAPNSVPAGTQALQVTINGVNFLVPAAAGSGTLPGSVAEWLVPGAQPVLLATSVTSTILATATIPTSLLAAPLNASIVMVQPNGLTSNAMPFTVLAPTITSLQPSSGTAGMAAFPLSVSGANFINGSQVVFGGTPLATTFFGSGTLNGAVTAALVSKPGPVSVTVVNPGGATSAAVTFQVASKITILNTSLPAAQSGVLYDVTLAATGGTAPYTWSAQGLPSTVTLNPTTGEIRGSFNTTGTFSVTVLVTDSAGQIQSAQYSVTVGAAPVQLQITTASPLPTATVGTAYTQSFAATGGTQPYHFALVGTPPPGLSFSAGALAGTPTTVGQYSFSIAVSDSAGGSAISPFQLTVSPAALVLTGSVPASSTVGSSLSVQFGATGGISPYTFSYTGSLPTGTVFNTGALAGNLTAPGTFAFTVTVTDNTGAALSKTFVINVTTGPLTITTTSLPNGSITQFYSATLAASGGVPAYTWSANGLPPGLGISPGGAITGSPTTAGLYTVAATVSDSTGTKASQNFPVTITAGALTITTQSLPGGVAGTAYSATLAANGGAPPYTWSASGLPSGLSISSAGAISGSPSAAGTATVAVTVTDSAKATASTSFSLAIVSGTPVISGISPSSAPAGGPSFTLTVTGSNFTNGAQIVFGGTPLTTNVTSSAVPAGRRLAAGLARPVLRTAETPAATSTTLSATVPAALISKPGVLAVTVVGPGGVSSAAATFTVYSKLTLLTTGLPAGQTGTSYNVTLAATGGLPPYNWSVTGLPNTIILNPVAGTISGIWATAGTYSGVITVTDASGQSASSQYSTTVTTPTTPLSIVTSTLPQGTVGQGYGATVFANGGSPPYNFSFSGNAPPGLTFSGGSNGSLSGTPTTAGTFSFNATVTDNNNASASKGFSVTIAPAPITVTGSVSDATVGTSLNVKFGATGGVPPYTLSSSGSLPAGTTFSNGVLSGTVTATGTFTFTVTATDSAGSSSSKSFTIHATAATLVITTANLGNGTVGSPYSGSVSATGGVLPYTWTASGMPSGLSISAVGAISGTPIAAGTYSVSVTVTDSAGTKASQGYTVTIASGLTVTTASLGTATAGAPYSASLAAAGGVPPYTYSVSGLPDGLSASASGAISGTPATAGSYTVGVTVTDSQGSKATASLALTVVAPPLKITTTSLGNGTVGTAVSATLAATGGVPPYSWTATGLPAGVTISQGGALTGTPTAAGSYTVAATVTDNAGTTASASLAWTIALPSVPSLTLTGLGSTGTSASQSTLSVSLGTSYPVDVTVTLTLTFSPASGGDDPAVRFSSGGGDGRTVTITVPAGQTAGASTIGVQTGTVAGTITVTAQMKAAGQDVTPSPAPTITTKIAAAPPVITSVSGAVTTGGFTVTLVGYSNTRDMTQGTFTFTAASGVSLQTSTVTVPLSSLFSAWYGSSASAQYGSQFTFTQPFTVSGTGQAVTSVSVTLTNSAGTSQSASGTVH